MIRHDLKPQDGNVEKTFSPWSLGHSKPHNHWLRSLLVMNLSINSAVFRSVDNIYSYQHNRKRNFGVSIRMKERCQPRRRKPRPSCIQTVNPETNLCLDDELNRALGKERRRHGKMEQAYVDAHTQSKTV
jgi:hypothetical protein